MNLDTVVGPLTNIWLQKLWEHRASKCLLQSSRSFFHLKVVPASLPLLFLPDLSGRIQDSLMVSRSVSVLLDVTSGSFHFTLKLIHSLSPV